MSVEIIDFSISVAPDKPDASAIIAVGVGMLLGVLLMAVGLYMTYRSLAALAPAATAIGPHEESQSKRK
jgi:hypothetical protein